MNIEDNTPLADHLLESRSAQQRTIWLVVLVIVAFVVWAHFAALDEIVRGPGKVIPVGKTQIIQNLEGGILSELHVHEGDEIARGDVLARLDDTKFRGAHGELSNEYQALQIRLARLSSELAKADTFEPRPEHADANPDIATSERQLFEARVQEYRVTKAAFTEAVNLQEQELKLLEKLARKGVVPDLDVIKSRQSTSNAQKDLSALDTEYTLLRAQEYADALNESKKLEQTMAVRLDQLHRTTLRSPVRGIVNKVLVNTIGGVVAPGEEIVELIPLDDELRVEARINPKDIAFVYPGMPATVKFSAYDYTIYGSFRGVVRHISADTFEDETQRDAPPYYKVEIEVDQQQLVDADADIAIRPGMLAEAELHVGEKTVLKYLLKPLFKTTEAFREP